MTIKIFEGQYERFDSKYWANRKRLDYCAKNKSKRNKVKHYTRLSQKLHESRDYYWFEFRRYFVRNLAKEIEKYEL